MHRLGAGGAVAAEDPGHPQRGGGQKALANGRVIGQCVPCALGRNQHLGRIPAGEAGAHRLAQHRDRELWSGALRRGAQDLVAAHHRPAARRDPPGQVVDVQQLCGVTGRRAGVVEQRAG